MIRAARAGDESRLRAVRIRALCDAPREFDSTLERELARPDAEWSRWIRESAIFLAVEGGTGADDSVVGLAAGIAHDADPRAAFLVSVWVDPRVRGRGTGVALVRAVQQWARDARRSPVWLHVVADNAAAIRCYERCGFRPTGAELRRDRDGVRELEMRWDGPEA